MDKAPARGHQPPDMSSTEPISPFDPAPGLASLRAGRKNGALSGEMEFASGVTLHADPALGLSGRFTSPAGRLLELSVRTSGPGAWAALHVALHLDDLSGLGWVGLACRTAAPSEVMIRPCLRSGTGDGFTDHFFGKHILSGPEPMAHLDAIEAPALPARAPWRELVLFCPRADFAWHLHDLRVFAA